MDSASNHPEAVKISHAMGGVVVSISGPRTLKLRQGGDVVLITYAEIRQLAAMLPADKQRKV